MNKPKSKLSTKIATSISAHPWLKIIALILAVIVWFYVRDEINKFNY